jgi:hypothetical protein
MYIHVFFRIFLNFFSRFARGLHQNMVCIRYVPYLETLNPNVSMEDGIKDEFSLWCFDKISKNVTW